MVGYPVERSDGDVFAAGLDRRQVGSVHANSFGYFGLRLTAAGSRVAHTLAQLLKSLHRVDYIPHACRLKPSPLMFGGEPSLPTRAETKVVRGCWNTHGPDAHHGKGRDMHQCATLIEQASGYLAADHTIRRITPDARESTAAAILAHYPPTSAFDDGFRQRLLEFTAPMVTVDHRKGR